MWCANSLFIFSPHQSGQRDEKSSLRRKQIEDMPKIINKYSARA